MVYSLDESPAAAAKLGRVSAAARIQPRARRRTTPSEVAQLRRRRSGAGRPQPSYASICRSKRLLDLAIALPTLVFVSPLMLVVALCVRLQDGGPVIFRHERIGFDGRTFGCLKFRTMYVDADARLERHLADNPEAAAEWAETQKLKDDPRVVGWIGRFLRTTSLDELPQLINIIRGEMSVVGPRPIVEDEVEKYGDYFRYYTSVRPGVTGLWQVSGRNDVSYEKRVRLDSLYARKWSVGFDLKILLQTIPAVIQRRGAY